MLGRLFGSRKSADRVAARALYDRIVEAARTPELYEVMDVPDTPLGRYEMVCAHMVLFLRRIRNEPLDDVGQILTDEFFLDVDHSLRELGIGDMGVPKRVKKLARMFYGRAKSYTDALDAGDETSLAEALLRNVRPDLTAWPEAPALALYMVASARILDQQPASEFAAGRLHF